MAKISLSNDSPAYRSGPDVTAIGAKTHYKRVLVKLSGEALMGDDAFGINPGVLDYLRIEINALVAEKVETALVIGAGNIFRGVAGAASGMDRPLADNMGMLATTINCLALTDCLNQAGIRTVVMSAIPMTTVCESFNRDAAVNHLRHGRVVIFAGGTGNPFFTTDTAAVLRGLEIDADIICKATRVDGVYDRDPLKEEGAIKYDTLTFAEILRRNLKVMDAAAISLAMDNKKPLLVFNMNRKGNILAAVQGKNVGTIVNGG